MGALENVVGEYIEASSSHNWDTAQQALTGEALIEARANIARTRDKWDIVSVKYNTRLITSSTAEIIADITRKNSENADRVAYKFFLINKNGNWKIYKTEWSNYIHDELRPAINISRQIDRTVRGYIELPFNERRNQSRTYLAGKLLNDSIKVKNLPQEPESGQTIEKVIEINCLGASQDYVIVQVDSVLIRYGKEFSVKAIVDLVDVNGAWKIIRLDIADITEV